MRPQTFWREILRGTIVRLGKDQFLSDIVHPALTTGVCFEGLFHAVCIHSGWFLSNIKSGSFFLLFFYLVCLAVLSCLRAETADATATNHEASWEIYFSSCGEQQSARWELLHIHVPSHLTSSWVQSGWVFVTSTYFLNLFGIKNFCQDI